MNIEICNGYNAGYIYIYARTHTYTNTYTKIVPFVHLSGSVYTINNKLIDIRRSLVMEMATDTASHYNNK